MPLNTSSILPRVDALLAITASSSDDAQINEAYQGTLTVLRAVHGAGGIQESQLLQAMSAAERTKDEGNWNFKLRRHVRPAIQGALNALKGDLAAGLVGNVAMQVSGEVLGDLLGLAKAGLADGGEDQKNVAAVLVAAAFEDTLRRMATAKAGVTDRPKLEDVIGRLKASGVLTGPSVSTANGYLKFRNDALHADWSKLQAATVGSALAFVEGLLLAHFA